MREALDPPTCLRAEGWVLKDRVLSKTTTRLKSGARRRAASRCSVPTLVDRPALLVASAETLGYAKPCPFACQRNQKGGDDVPPSIERAAPYARDNEEVPMWARLERRKRKAGSPPGRAKTRPQQRFTMRTTILAVTVFVAIAAASASRTARQAHYQPSGGAAANRGPAGYEAYQPQQAQAQSFRPQVQAAPQQPYDPSGFQGQPAPRGRATVQSFGGGLARPTQQSQQGGQQSTFTCSSKTDGYYADNSVNCQVFHYCVGGAKHSWMCP
ncbi:hypothetical protein MRX96_009282 [Rhipicephalus microplus]